MIKLFSYFKFIDEFVFRLINDWSSSDLHQKISDYFNTLDLELQKKLNRALTIIFLILPIILVLILIGTNSGIKSTLFQREKILELISKHTKATQKLNYLGRSIVSKVEIKKRDQLVAQLNKILNTNRIKLSNLTILDFSAKTIGNKLNMANAKVSFRGFSNSDFFNFFKEALKTERLKVEKLLILKNKKTNLLSGEFSIHHFSLMQKLDKK